jgi:glycosyltransferase involved in cell wall biosynthesis
MFGGELTLPFSPLMALVPKLFGVHVVTTFHGGMGLKEVDKVFVQENGKKLPPFIIRIAFRYIFTLFSLGSNKIIVHEEFQKGQLVEEHNISTEKISIIPHGIPENVEVLLGAKKKLGLENKKVFLYMGFAAKYKGLPELFNVYKKYISLPENKDTVLIIGAGMAPRLENDAEYKIWYQDLKNKYESLGEFVRFVGFIPNNEIALYYSACDAVLFPYTRRLAASGPMAIAIGYDKDIIISNILQGEGSDVEIYNFDLTKITKVASFKKDRIWHVVAEKHISIYKN